MSDSVPAFRRENRGGDTPSMTTPPLDPARRAEVAQGLKDLGVTGILIEAAQLGYIREVKCGMPECRCPEEIGGAYHFDPVVPGAYGDWEPTHEHFPITKRDGGHRTVDNSVLAHRLCNRIDYSIEVGRSHESDLKRIEKARGAATES